MVGIAFIAFCSAAQTEGTITYSTKAAPITTVLSDLSKIIGKRLAAGPEMAPEILMISVRDLPSSKLIEKIATVTSGQWVGSGDTYTLKADPGARRKEEQSEIQTKATELRKQISARLKLLSAAQSKSAGGKGSEDVEVMGLQNSEPSDEKAILTILDSMDPTVLATVSGSRRLVWATNNPTAMQGMLPEGAGEIVTRWVEEHNRAVKDTPTNDAVPDLGDSALNAKVRDLVKQQADRNQPVQEPLAKAILIAQSRPYFGREFILKTFNAKGKVLLTATTNLGLGLIEEVQALSKPKHPSPTLSTTASNLPPFKFSPEAAQFLEAFGKNRMASPGLPSVSPEVSKRLARLDLVEPLSFVASELLGYYAGAQGTQIVADVPDEFFLGNEVSLLQGAQKITSPEQALAAVEKNKLLSVRSDGGVTTVMSSTPAESRLRRISRAQLSTLVDLAAKKGYLSLDEISAYALNNGPLDETSLGTAYATLFFPSAFGSGMGGGLPSWNAYRFYGSLSGDQRNQLMGGGSENFITLTSEQSTYAADYLFSSDATYGDAQPTKVDESSPFAAMMDGLNAFGIGGGSPHEPTELMPDGIGKGFLTETSRREDVLSFAQGTSFGGVCLGPSEYGMLRAVSNSGLPGSANLSLPQKARLGQRLNLEIIFHVSNDVGAHCKLQDIYFDKEAQYVALDQLPSSFTSKVDSVSSMMKRITDQVGKLGQKPNTP